MNKIIEVHITPGVTHKITVLVNDNGNIKAYQSSHYSELNNDVLRFVADGGSKLSFDEAVKLFPNIDKSDYDI